MPTCISSAISASSAANQFPRGTRAQNSGPGKPSHLLRRQPNPPGSTATRAARRDAQKRPESRQPEAAAPRRLGQFYVTGAQDEAPRRIRATGPMENTDVSGSAVARYTLDQLLADKTPDELVRLPGTPKGQKQDRRGGHGGS